MPAHRVACVVWLFALAAPPTLFAQPPDPLTLPEALQYAADHYPSVKAAIETVAASDAGVALARSAYLPHLDAVWQSNRATANNVFGQVLPQSVIPSMSGPVLPSSSGQSAWGSVAGALLSWEPFDFGLRRAGVGAAESAVARARAGEALTRLDVQRAVGAAFLSVAAAERLVAATRADVDRRDVVARAVRALVDSQLRPGADGSRADAERAAAATRLIQSRQALIVAQTTLARLLGTRAGALKIDASALLDEPPAAIGGSTASEHPLAQMHRTSLEAARAQQRVLARTDLPRLYLQSSVFARGSGADPGGGIDGGVGGLGLERGNWAAGFQLQFPNLFDYASLKARRSAAASAARAESALYDEAMLTIASDQDAAAAMVDTARAVAANTPVQLAAARQSELQARARYDVGLASIVEVAEAQNLLVQAELQDQTAHLEVWRALFADAVAHGSIAPIIEHFSSPLPGRR